MPQDDSYPDPKQLKAFAQEPMPFTDVENIHLEEGEYLVGNYGNVFYRYRPTYIRVSPAADPDEAYEADEREGCTLNHGWCFKRAADLEVSEDIICAAGITVLGVPEDDAQFGAFWILDEIQIVVPDDS